MATYRGQEGSFTVSTNVVGEVYGWTFNGSLETLDDTVMGDVARTFKPGLASWTAAVRARFDYADTQQAAVLGEIISGTPQGDLAEVRLRLSATKYIAGAVVVSGATIVAELGNIVDLALTLQGSGPATMTWS